MGDRDNGNYDQETSKRLIRGIANNMPELLPDLRLSPVEKRKALRDFGLTKPRSLSLDQIKMAAFPRNIDPVIRKAASKLALALFYKHKKKAAREDYFIGAYWTQTANKKVMTDWMSGNYILELAAWQTYLILDRPILRLRQR